MFKAVADILSFGVRVFINPFILHLKLGKKPKGKNAKKRTKKLGNLTASEVFQNERTM